MEQVLRHSGSDGGGAVYARVLDTATPQPQPKPRHVVERGGEEEMARTGQHNCLHRGVGIVLARTHCLATERRERGGE